MAVTVTFYETQTARKANDALGVFTIKVEPEKIPEVSEKLKGLTDSAGNDLYELAVERRAKKVEDAITNCKFAACDKVREIVGELGVLVASIPEDTTPEITTVEKK